MSMGKETQASAFDLDKYRTMALRRRWEIVFGAIPALLLGLLFCLVAQRIYKASTTIVLVPQRVPEAYIRTTVTGDVQERIRGIWQEITSRTNLERVIQQYDLYPDARERFPMETVVEIMREKVVIESPREARSNAFVLSYEGEDPELIAKVVNALANMFIEENLRLREAQAQGTADFLAQELENVSIKLKEREEVLRQYKTAHMGELPEQNQANLTVLTQLQQQIESTQEDIRRAEERKVLLQGQIAEEEARVRAASVAAGPAQPGAAQGPVSIGELRAQLAGLLTRYTSEHPDVVALRQRIASLEKEQGDSGSGRSEGLSPTGGVESSVVLGLRYQIRGIDMEIASLREETARLKTQIAEYQRRIEDAPKREQELIEITRDYENLKTSYENLLTRKIEAEQAAALEARQKGEQFRIVDTARVPEVPVWPDAKKLLFMTLVAAIGCGVGLAFAREFLAKGLYDPEDVSALFKIPVVASIPYLMTMEERRGRRRKTVLLASLAGIGYAAAATLLVILVVKGPGAWTGIL